MSKKYTAKEVKEILSDVLCGAFEHIDALVKEMEKMPTAEEIAKDPQAESRAKLLTLTVICINDIIHPAHEIMYQLFNDKDEIFDLHVKNHEIAVKNKIVPNCLCAICRKKKRYPNLEKMMKEGKDKAEIHDKAEVNA